MEGILAFKKNIFLFMFVFVLTQIKAQTQTVSLTLSSNKVCVNDVVTGTSSFNGGTAPTSWSWTSNPSTSVVFNTASSQNPKITFGASGSYTLTLTVQPSGATATITVTVDPKPVITVTSTTDTICKGGVGATLTASGATSYTWSPSTGLSAANVASVTANPTSTTTYSVVGVSIDGCKDTVRKKIVVLTNTAVDATSNLDTVCLGASATLTATPAGAASYSWSPTTGLSCPTCASTNFMATLVGKVKIYVTATGKCISPVKDSVNIFVKNCKPVPGFIMPDPASICRFSCVTYKDTSRTQPLKYMWVVPGGKPDTSYEQNPTICYNIESSLVPGGVYPVKLVVTNSMGVKDSVTKYVTVLPTPIANINNGASTVTIQTGDNATLNASQWTQGAVSFSWSPPKDLGCTNCGITVASPMHTSTYVVTATAANGCKDDDTIKVIVELRCGEVFVPNVFSPNKDGSNDVLHVKNNCLSTMEFRVFNRWGELVYTAKNVDDGWDGTYNGKELDPGVFVYTLDAVLVNGATVSKKGNITLIR